MSWFCVELDVNNLAETEVRTPVCIILYAVSVHFVRPVTVSPKFRKILLSLNSLKTLCSIALKPLTERSIISLFNLTSSFVWFQVHGLAGTSSV